MSLFGFPKKRKKTYDKFYFLSIHDFRTWSWPSNRIHRMEASEAIAANHSDPELIEGVIRACIPLAPVGCPHVSATYWSWCGRMPKNWYLTWYACAIFQSSIFDVTYSLRGVLGLTGSHVGHVYMYKAIEVDQDERRTCQCSSICRYSSLYILYL